MQKFLTRRYPIWLCAVAGFVILFGAFYLTNADAKDAGAATGYAFIPGLFGAAVAAVLGLRHNRSVERKSSNDAGHP